MSETVKAIAVNVPNKTVGEKFDKVKTKNPIEIVMAV